ncbi:hypothetical protein WMW72_32560 [Paenibacillus filicis]|uniref:Copper amine oxidase-like N-terminal domain-containing protein n=1 Tax=Paenibacillus filicis TaxID=669464 RepID=A0ABU9DUS2_9BACL
MWKKVILLALSGAVLQIVLLASSSNAYEYADTPTEPADGFYIPKKLTLVEKMPYYVIPNTLKNTPEGSFSPQTVEVIEAEAHWATSGNWWKIHTDFGDRWIKTTPWQIEVPPPATIRLMSETPLYAQASEKGGPTASLSPQEVTVVDAEKSWFRQAEMDYNPKRWIKIHTTWLGDQWVHLHLDEIGAVQPLDRTVYYPSVYYRNSPHMDYITYQYEGLLTQMFVHQTAKYRNLLGSSYQFDTEYGPKWSFTSGMPITSEKKTIQRKYPSPLFAYPDSNAEIVTELPPGNLNVVETTLNEDGYLLHEAWFHVENEQAKGWFSPTYAEPDDTVDDTASIQLRGYVTAIFRYPNTRIPLNNGQIGPQTLHPLAAWTAPDGTRWYKIDSFVGQGWVQLYPFQDSVVLKGREDDVQIRSTMLYQGVFYQNDSGIFTFGSEVVGKVLNGEPYFSASFLAEQYHYDLTGPDTNGWWSLKNKAGYTFQIKADEKSSKTFWNGALANQVNLTASPVTTELKLPPLLSLSDVRKLFGATTAYHEKVAFGDKHVTLSSREYEIAGFNLPIAVDGNELHLSGLLYESTYLDNEAISPSLQILVKSQDTHDNDLTNIQLAKVKQLYKLGSDFGVNDVTLQFPLKPGINHLSLVFKAGERILEKKDWDVTARAQN